MSIDPKSTYYDAGGIETIKIIEAKLTREQFKGYILGSMIGYQCRCNFKEDITRDMEKIATYSKLFLKKKLGEDPPPFVTTISSKNGQGPLPSSHPGKVISTPPISPKPHP